MLFLKQIFQIMYYNPYPQHNDSLRIKQALLGTILISDFVCFLMNHPMENQF
jgi:hypothetical protein